MQVVRQGADTLLTYLDTGYGAGTGGYALGAVTSVSAVTFKNGSNSAVPDTLTTNGFAWFDESPGDPVSGGRATPGYRRSETPATICRPSRS